MKVIPKKEYYSSISSIDRIKYCFAHKVDEDTVEQITAMHTCRDYMQDSVRAHVHRHPFDAKGRHDYFYGKDKPIDMNTLRMLVAFGKNRFKEGDRTIELAVKVLNLYCEKLEWNYINIHKVTEFLGMPLDRTACYLLTGSSRWIRNPYTLSFLTIILRTIVNIELRHYEKIEKCNSPSEFINIMRPMIKDGSAYIYDSIYMNKLLDMHYIIIYNDYVFKGIGLKRVYDKHCTDFHNKGGIYNASRQRTPIKEVNTRISRICDTI